MSENMWIRVAGHTGRIKEGDAFGWRCYARCEGPEIPLKDLHVIGQATPMNMRLGTDTARTNALGLLAWFDLYGTLEVRDGVALVTLADVPMPDDWK